MVQKLKIELAALEMFGGEQVLRDRIEAFITARRDHKFTENIPAPTEHPVIEEIVQRFGGHFEIADDPIPPPPPEPVIEPIPGPPPPPEPTFEELLDQRYAQLAFVRNRARNSGVVYDGHRFSSDALTLAELLAAKDIGGPVKWKTIDRQFVTLGKNEISALIAAIRSHAQKCFDREAHIIGTRLQRMSNIETLKAFDATEAWDAE